MNIYRHMHILLIGAVLILLSGCPNGMLSGAAATSEATFTFEAGPGTLLWYAPENIPMKRALTDQEAETGIVTLKVLKGSVTPVLLYRNGTVEPEGAIWPVSAEISRTGGFASRMLWRLLTETEERYGSKENVREWCCHFNWKRFSEKTAALENPWQLDQQKILRAIAAGTFKMKDLRLLDP